MEKKIKTLYILSIIAIMAFLGMVLAVCPIIIFTARV